jgi:benzoyl-CoA reductase/2-hydroxyglutaryl-CoA dehydratase subunit BcrC/BadD/HgdB
MSDRDDAPGSPQDVWHLVERADEFVKYAQNRDPARAYAQARETLRKAMDQADRLADRQAAKSITAQINRRLEDLRRLETAP